MNLAIVQKEKNMNGEDKEALITMRFYYKTEAHDHVETEIMAEDINAFESDQANMAIITIFKNGTILTSNERANKLLGYNASDLAWQPITKLLPQLDGLSLTLGNEINPYLRLLSVTGHRFEVIGKKNKRFGCSVFYNMKEEFGKSCMRISLAPNHG